jgi:exodeoxyribonuclease III
MPSFKITTWNVNGLRALLSRNGLAPVLPQKPDVIMLQEIKSRPDQIVPELAQTWQGYSDYWNPAERPGYSGVAAYAGIPAIEVYKGLGEERFDVEGRVIRLRFPEFTLINAYFPSGQRDYGRVTYKLDFYAALLDRCDEWHRQGEKLVIGGDFNTAHNEIDLRHARQNRNTSGFLPEERAWVDLYLEHGFIDAYRELYPERVQYTWWTYRLNARQNQVGWRLDYFMVSKDLMPLVQDVLIHEDIPGSDHCPVTLSLNLPG